MSATAPAAAAEAHPRRAPLSVGGSIFVALVLVMLALSLLIAVVLPYGEWDAMAFGTWSRLIAEHWPHLRFAGVGGLDYQRPLFYALQGTLWSLFGFHQALGRVLSLAFSAALVGAVAFVAAHTVRVERRFAAALAALAVVLITPFSRYVAAGLSDIPAAACVAATAASLLVPRVGRARLPLVALTAALATLAKPSSLPALAGLALCVLIGPRVGLRRRVYGACAIAAGAGSAVVYDAVQASYVHMGLRSFLTGGTTDGFYAGLAGADRRRNLLDGSWLGPELRVVLLFALAYALARLGLAHRVAVLVSVPVALVASWLGPHLAGAHGVRVGIFGSGSWVVEVAVLALAASLALALAAPPAAVPDRLLLARGLVWLAPPLFVWGWRLVYDVRLLAPAWPPLVLLVVWSLLPVFTGAEQRRAWLVAVPVAALIVIGAYGTQNINGLGASGWRSLEADGFAGLGNPAAMRNIAFGGDFSAEMNALAPQVRRGDRILTYDQRLQFFYGDQVNLQPPLRCSQLAGNRIFVLLESDELRAVYGARSTARFWQGCAAHLTRVDERPGAYAIFVNGALASTVGGCGAPAAPAGLAVAFGPSFKSAQAAQPFLKHLVALGFVQARIEQLGCASYRIEETGVPDANVGASIIAEAKTVQVPAQLLGK